MFTFKNTKIVFNYIFFLLDVLTVKVDQVPALFDFGIESVFGDGEVLE